MGTWRQGASWLGVAVLWAASGCAGGQGGASSLGARSRDADDGKLYAGDPAGPPRMEGLPECDVSRAALSEEMRRAWLLAEESLGWPPPLEPDAAGAGTLDEWSDGVLKVWMEQKSARAIAARQALDAAAGLSIRERIMAGALLGLVFEDVADVLLELPMPDELKSEPEVQGIYREVLASNAEPYLANARSAYAACAGNAEANHMLRHWGRYCEHRKETLPGGLEPVADDTTEVTVERD